MSTNATHDAPLKSGPTFSSTRAAVRKEVTSIRWEMGMLVFVIIYFAVVFATFALEDKQVHPPLSRVLR